MLSIKSLSLEEMRGLAEAAVKEAAVKGWAITVAVVDCHGLLRLLISMDGARPPSVESARGKAYTAWMQRRPSSEEASKLQKRPGFQRYPGYTPMAGGLPVFCDKECVGAVGVAGMSEEEDEHCANAALTAFNSCG